jgi:hypothetical protein
MIRCYAWPLTVRATEDLQLHVSTGHPRFGVRLLRYGATVREAPAPATVWDGDDLPTGRPDEAWGWSRYTVPLPQDLAGGVALQAGER